MIPSLLVMVREGFEAALIISIVYAYLRKIGRDDLERSVWMGVGAAAAIAIAAGVILRISIGSLEGTARMITFAVVSFGAAIVLTWMVFWMRRQARAIKGELQEKLDDAVASGHATTAVVAVAFFAVLREGLEAALFLLAATTADNGRDVVIGGTIGLAIAAVLGYLVYKGSARLPMKLFFQVTGMIIVVFAAGLVARGVMFLQIAGLDSFNDSVYDLTRYAWLTTSTEMGRFLGAMFGWDPRPSIEQVVAWLAYFVPVTYFFLRPTREPAAPPVVTEPMTPAPRESVATTH